MSLPTTIRPTHSDMEYWLHAFFPPVNLWWWDDADIPHQNLITRVISRSDVRHDPLGGDIAYVNAYHLWAIHRDASRVLVDDGCWSAALSPQERAAVSSKQVQYARGMCIERHRFPADVAFPDHTVASEKVVLDRSLWLSLPEHARLQVLESELAEWDRATTHELPGGVPGHITNIANTFIHQEGVNCLAVTSFAITASTDDLLQWMMPEPFASILERAGYAETRDSTPHAGDVLTFHNGEGDLVHAAFALTSDRFLNKNGQSMFNPITITNMADLQGDWSGYSMQIMRR